MVAADGGGDEKGKEKSEGGGGGVMDRDRAENWSTCNMTQMDKSI